MHPSDRTYRNQTVRIADIAVISDVVENVTFENCIIEGPAVIAMLGIGRLQDSNFEGTADAILWIIPDDRVHVIGAVAMVGCTIVGCTLRRIGLVVQESQADEMRRHFSG